jgi:hypothetical protein
VATSPGVAVRRDAQFSTSVSLTLDRSIQGGGDNAHVNGSIQGEVDLTPSVDFEASVLHGFLGVPNGAEASFTASLGVSASATVSLSGTLEQKWQIGDIQSAPITVPVGPVPVVIVLSIPVFATMSVTGQIGLTESVNFQFGEKASWTSVDPGKLTLTNLSQSPHGATPSLSLLVQDRGTVGIEADPKLLIYDVTGPEVDVSLDLVATIIPTARSPDPWFSLDLQLGVDAAWAVNIPFVSSTKVSASIATVLWPIYRVVGTPSSISPLTVTPTAPTVQPGGSQQFTVAGASGSVTWTRRG